MLLDAEFNNQGLCMADMLQRLKKHHLNCCCRQCIDQKAIDNLHSTNCFYQKHQHAYNQTVRLAVRKREATFNFVGVFLYSERNVLAISWGCANIMKPKYVSRCRDQAENDDCKVDISSVGFVLMPFLPLPSSSSRNHKFHKFSNDDEEFYRLCGARD
jgi:hypothetical protein